MCRELDKYTTAKHRIVEYPSTVRFKVKKICSFSDASGLPSCCQVRHIGTTSSLEKLLTCREPFGSLEVYSIET